MVTGGGIDRQIHCKPGESAADHIFCAGKLIVLQWMLEIDPPTAEVPSNWDGQTIILSHESPHSPVVSIVRNGDFSEWVRVGKVLFAAGQLTLGEIQSQRQRKLLKREGEGQLPRLYRHSLRGSRGRVHTQTCQNHSQKD